MGGCIGTQRDSAPTSVVSSDGGTNSHGGVSTGKNHPLRHEPMRWKSDVPLTEGQLRSRRDEFWDTAPAFEGRKEIWDALKAAASAAESDDYELAQAIIDGASIALPNGTLMECYDELGNRYQLPVYCLSYPVNIVCEDDTDSPAEVSEPMSPGIEVPLKVRLSTTGRDMKLLIHSNDTVAIAKKRLQSLEGIEPLRQRWFFGGKLLGDKLKIEDAKIPNGYVIQVVISPDELTIVSS